MPTPVEVLSFICLILTAYISLLLIMKQRDRAIYEDLKGRFDLEKREKEASLEFNSYFLNNYHSKGAVTLEINSKNYILYRKDGDAILEEKSEEFTAPEKIFYSFYDPGDSGTS